MRIIAGSAKGRRLAVPDKQHRGKAPIRPTADRAREALFSILADEVVDAHVLDLFAGTGALGLEALSRGARDAVFVDRSPKALELVRQNVSLCGFSARSRLVRRDLAKGLFRLEELAPAGGFDLVFLDPPYGKKLAERVLQQLADSGLLRPQGLVVAEEASGEALPAAIGRLHLEDHRRYGDTGFWLYRMEESP